jgi:hypothetical protein
MRIIGIDPAKPGMDRTVIIGKCEQCQEWPVEIEGGLCDKCRTAHLQRCEKLARYGVVSEVEDEA